MHTEGLLIKIVFICLQTDRQMTLKLQPTVSLLFLFLFSCKAQQKYVDKEFYKLDQAVRDSCEKWNKIDLYNQLKFGLYCYHAQENAFRKINPQRNDLWDTIPYYTMSLYAYQVKKKKDTLDINYEFYDGTTSFYMYSTSARLNGFVIHADTIVKYKWGENTKQILTGNFSLQKEFYLDTTVAYEIFRKNEAALNEWLRNEYKKRGVIK
jgi:hypothetical protein